MIVFYGKGKVGNSFQALCDYLGKECYIVDDKDEIIDTTLLQKADVIIPTPGMPQTHHVYQTYRAKIVSELDMCAHIMAEEHIAPISIGITGTDGKSTVTRIIAEALRQLLPTHTVHITGNFDEPMGQTILNILKAGTKAMPHIFVVECSSFMLYPTKAYHFAIGIWTNFAPDHLNRHPTMDEYFSAKQHLFETSTLCFTGQEVFEQLPASIQGKTTVYKGDYSLEGTYFVGEHNAKNCAVAQKAIRGLCSLYDISLTHTAIQEAIGTIKPLAHRLQIIATMNGITRYDDGKSTSAQSLQAALEAMSTPVVVICGGSDKKDTFSHLAPLFAKHTVYGVFLGQTAPQFAELFQKIALPYTHETSMRACVQQARKAAQTHHASTILFSPGCASLDMFINYEDRAKQFLAGVEEIKEKEKMEKNYFPK